MLWKVLAIGSLFSAVTLILILQTTTPTSVGPLGIIFVFGLLYMSALGLLTFLLIGIHRLLLINKRTAVFARDIFSLRQAYYFATVLSLAPIILLAMRSVGGISFYEVILVVLFELIACVYIAKRQI